MCERPILLGQKILLFVFLCLLPASPVSAIESFVKVRVFSPYAINQVQISGALLKLRVQELKKPVEEVILPPNFVLKIASHEKQIALQFGSKTKQVNEIWVEPPRGSFMAVE